MCPASADRHADFGCFESQVIIHAIPWSDEPRIPYNRLHIPRADG
jgi:hypothetical protein